MVMSNFLRNMRKKNCGKLEMVPAKGKEKVTDGGGKGKRKWRSGGGDDKTGHRKRKNHGVIQFFDDVAYQVDEDGYSSDDSQFNTNDFLVDELSSELILSSEIEKVPPLPLLLNGEEMSKEELERILEERYKPGAGYVTYAEDGYNYEHKSSIETDYVHVPSAIDPKIWKVKCMIGRERYSALCLMQKYVDLEYLGTKLQIISAFAPDHAKGFILIEAEKQHHIYEACKGLYTIYSSRATLVPNKEISRLLSIRSKSSSAITEGMWARVKNGKYKGDLALVLAVNEARKKVTAKLIPRIDLKAMAEKFGGGVAAKRTSIPPQRLISFSELDEFRPLIHCRRDRDTKEIVEVLDGMMLKDGYLYKKISIDSLSFWDVMPTEDELSKFEPSEKVDFTDAQWLSDLFGEKTETQIAIFEPDKRSGNIFEIHDLVFFGRDFGVVISSEKDDDIVKVIRESSEGPLVVTVKKSELKIASFDKKLFSVSDHNSRTISINDSVRVLDGPLKDRQGVVKKIYKGILFLFDESEEENNGYICITARLCEKVNISGDTSHEKVEGSEPAGPSEFADSPSPLINKTNFKSEDNEIFSVGQSSRIRVGPLKGYLCRVLAIRRSYVTVKLDSQQKIITVKVEHLSEVRGRDSSISQGYITPFDGASGKEDDSSWQIKGTSDHQISSWGKKAFEPNPIDDGSWGRAVEKWRDQKTNNSWNKPKPVGADDCGSSWHKQDGGSSWNKPDGGFSFWSSEQPAVVNAEIGPKKDWKVENNSISEKSSKDQYDEDQGFGGWKKGGMRNRDDYSYQEGSWGRSKSFEGGRGSGGRRGRGRGGGRGRSFDQGPSTNWNKNRDKDATWSSKTTNWNRGQDSDNRGKRGGRRGGDRGGFQGRGGFGGRGGSEKEGGFRGRGTGFRGRGGRGKGGW